MKLFFALTFYFFIFQNTQAQENYEIQVYSAPTLTKKSTIFELHSNYTFNGNKLISNGVLPSNHSTHETVEITTGITNCFEIGLYLFTNATPNNGFNIVGTHIRPRITAPSKWKLPVGLSLSAEVGTQKAAYAEEIWSVELRPIIDKQWHKFYASINPTLGIALKSSDNIHTPVFNPNIKLSYQFFKTTSIGLEYYGSTGFINHFDKIPDQSHAIYFVYDLVGNAQWELNIGTGFGLTNATDKLVGKVLVGRRINWKKH